MTIKQGIWGLPCFQTEPNGQTIKGGKAINHCRWNRGFSGCQIYDHIQQPGRIHEQSHLRKDISLPIPRMIPLSWQLLCKHHFWKNYGKFHQHLQSTWRVQLVFQVEKWRSFAQSIRGVVEEAREGTLGATQSVFLDLSQLLLDGIIQRPWTLLWYPYGGFFKWGITKTMVVSILKCSNDLDNLGVPPF